MSTPAAGLQLLRALALGLLLCPTGRGVQPLQQQQGQLPWKVFSVASFGASGSGRRLDTAAVRAAAAAVARNGGGQLLFPGGGTYLTGSFNVSSNTQVVIEPSAVVLGSTYGDDWPLVDAAAVWPWFGHGSDCDPGTEACRLMHQALLFAWNESNVTLGGGGMIDCNASPQSWWGCAQNLSRPPCNGYARPHCVMLANSSGVVVSDLRIRNSPDWTLHFAGVRDLHVHHVNVSNPPHEPNADGIDIDACANVLVEDCHVAVADDALCVKSGIDWLGRRFGRTAENIMFRRCTIGSGEGLTIGSEMSGGVRNVTFEDISLEGTSVGIRMKSQRGRGGIVSGITYRNISMHNIATDCVRLNLDYHPGIKFLGSQNLGSGPRWTGGRIVFPAPEQSRADMFPIFLNNGVYCCKTQKEKIERSICCHIIRLRIAHPVLTADKTVL